MKAFVSIVIILIALWLSVLLAKAIGESDLPLWVKIWLLS
jgi:hypothetical protein|nr:MAG TPA: hypothetical protein [Caudoviricetes sp.]